MAEKRRFLDVWIIDSNTVYREVPYEVVTDWVQQGRLLADDQLRNSGTAEWYRIGDRPEFAAYLPRSEPFRADDQAEMMEPVEVGFTWKHSREDEDDDPDMIPLIDVSLVLLVFFLMTAGGVALATTIQTPPAKSSWGIDDSQMIWIGIDRDGNGDPIYSIGEGKSAPSGPEDQGLITQEQLLARLDARLQERAERVEVVVRAHELLPSGIVRKLQIELERRPKFIKKYHGVSEPK